MTKLKELLTIQGKQNKEPSKSHKKLWKILRNDYPAFDFQKNQIVEYCENGDYATKYFLADFLCCNTKTIIQVNSTESLEDSEPLQQNGYSIMTLIENGGSLNKQRIKSELQKALSNGENSLLPTKPIFSFNDDVTPYNGELSEMEDINQEIATQSVQSQDEITDLIGNAPGWILRSGISIVAIVTIIILGMSAIIKYPDKISCTGVLTTQRPPIAHIAQSNAIIDAVFVKDEYKVKKGEPIIYIENNASRNDVRKLTAFISAYKKSDKIKFVLRNDVPDNLRVGEMQQLYASLELKYSEYRQVLRQSGVFQQIKTLGREMEKTKQLIASQEVERELFKRELGMVSNELSRSEKLHAQGIVSDADKDMAEGKLVQYQRQHENMTNGIIQNQIKIDQLKLKSQNLKEERSGLVKSNQFALSELINNLEGSYLQWKEKYLIEAEISGIVSLPQDVVLKMTLSVGQLICYVVPPEDPGQGPPAGRTGPISPQLKNQRYLKARSPALGISKLSEGNKAIIKLDAYPYKEFGSIIQQVSNISRLPFIAQEDQQFYEITVNLPDHLITDYGNQVEYRPEMSAQVDFITEDKSVLERILEQFISLVKQ